jgi:hypothetical protein
MNGALSLPAREFVQQLPGWQPMELAALMLAIRSNQFAKTTASDLLASALSTLDAREQPPTGRMAPESCGQDRMDGDPPDAVLSRYPKAKEPDAANVIRAGGLNGRLACAARQ